MDPQPHVIKPEIEVIAIQDAALALGVSTASVYAWVRSRGLARYLRKIEIRPGVWTHRGYITPEVYALVRRAYLSRMIPRGGPPLA